MLAILSRLQCVKYTRTPTGFRLLTSRPRWLENNPILRTFLKVDIFSNFRCSHWGKFRQNDSLWSGDARRKTESFTENGELYYHKHAQLMCICSNETRDWVVSCDREMQVENPKVLLEIRGFANQQHAEIMPSLEARRHDRVVLSGLAGRLSVSRRKHLPLQRDTRSCVILGT